MTPQEQWIADRALAYLHGDDANPEVGMGLRQCDAIDYAFKDAITPANKSIIEQYVAKKRDWR